MKTIALYAALDLHSSQSVLRSMDHEGNNQRQVRFATEAKSLREQVQALRKKRKSVLFDLGGGGAQSLGDGLGITKNSDVGKSASGHR